MTETVLQSFCERCGTRYTFTEQDTRRESGFSKVGRSLGLKGAHRPPVEPTVSTALPTHDPFRGTFHFCLGCRQYTCPNCWNADAGSCQSCQPLSEAAGSAYPAGAGPTTSGDLWPSRDLDQAKPRGTPEALTEAPPEPTAPWPPAAAPAVASIAVGLGPSAHGLTEPEVHPAAPTDQPGPAREATLQAGSDVTSGWPPSTVAAGEKSVADVSSAVPGSDDPWRDVRYSVEEPAAAAQEIVETEAYVVGYVADGDGAPGDGDGSAEQARPTTLADDIDGGAAAASDTLAEGWPDPQPEAESHVDPERWIQSSTAAMGAGWLARAARDNQPVEPDLDTAARAAAPEWPTEPVSAKGVAAVAGSAIATPPPQPATASHMGAVATPTSEVGAPLPPLPPASQTAAEAQPTAILPPTAPLPSTAAPASLGVTPPLAAAPPPAVAAGKAAVPPPIALGGGTTIQPTPGPFAAVSPLAPLPPPATPLPPPATPHPPPVPSPTGRTPQAVAAATYARPAPPRPPASPGPFAPPAATLPPPPTQPAATAPPRAPQTAKGPKAALLGAAGAPSAKAHPCLKCALPLSAQARYCRRCGTPQA